MHSFAGLTVRGNVSLGYSVYCRSLRLSSGPQPSKRAMHFEEVVARSRTNIDCTVKILGWNQTNGIGYFRLSDELIPTLTRGSVERARQLSQRLRYNMADIESFLASSDGRVTLHLSTLQFTSPPSRWREHGLPKLEKLGELLEMLGDRAWIECHLGGRGPNVTRQDDWDKRLVANFSLLPEAVRKRVTFENDRSWSPIDTLRACEKVNAPLTYDIEHHRLFARVRASEPPTTFTPQEIDKFVSAARNTWMDRGQPTTVHVSSPVDPADEQDRHADYVTYDDYARLRRSIARVGGQYFIVIEAKQLDLAVLQLKAMVSGRNPEWAVSDSSWRLV